MMLPILPPATIGIMGSGQLGRMLALAARRMGYRISIYSPEARTPAGAVADHETAASYEDERAVRAWAREVDVVTFEFENIPSATAAWCAESRPVRPGGEVLHICQHRLREKQFLAAAAIPLPPWAPVASEEDLRAAVARIGLPAVLKTAAFGYDGKGQLRLDPGADLAAAWVAFSQGEAASAVLEGWVRFEREISVLIARGTDGATSCYPVCENLHADHILDVTLVPARVSTVMAEQAQGLAERIAVALDLVGLLAVEMFACADGTLLVNELAPRPHNSGHWTFDAAVTSQFEQLVRAVCGLPLGSPALLQPCAMANLLGSVWHGGPPNWPAALEDPDIKLHLYDKGEPRPHRKMGHLLAFGPDADRAAASVRGARTRLAIAST